jgi:hypothetical protein
MLSRSHYGGARTRSTSASYNATSKLMDQSANMPNRLPTENTFQPFSHKGQQKVGDKAPLLYVVEMISLSGTDYVGSSGTVPPNR